jgi:hypothetical protein
MDKEQIGAALRTAEEIVASVSEPFRVVAYHAVASRLLADQPAVEQVQMGAQSVGNEPAAVAIGDLPDSVNELLAILKNRPHTDRFTAVTYHAFKRRGLESITTEEILDGYELCRMSKPSNSSDVVAKCFRKGHLRNGERRDGSKTWQLTGTGEKHVERLLREAMDGADTR